MRCASIATGLAAALALAAGLPAAPARAQPPPAVVVTPGSAETFRAAVQRFADGSAVPDPQRAEAFRQALGSALEFSNVFRVLDPKAFLGPEATGSLDDEFDVVCSDWGQIGADALIQGELSVSASRFSVEFRIWDTAGCRRLLRKRYRQAADADPKVIARRIADDVVEEFTGVRGVSSTEIAFVSDRSGNTEIYVMDADGGNQRPATANRSINNFPSWDAAGDAIAYTSYRDAGYPALFVSLRGRGRPGRLLPNLNSGVPQYRAVFDRQGDRVAVVLSADGAAEIYTARPNGKQIKRLTRHGAIDVSPTWSPDGSRLAFVSDRSGSPQVYIVQADGSGLRRLTYEGSYNTTPTWSPDGRWIAYETRLEGQFDIWLIDPEGRVNVPLVAHPRNDESPTWAPNSRKLAFSSNRRGKRDIYVIDSDGENVRRITRKAGNNKSPAWAPFPR
ncbi:MAG: hypothetical protein V3U03_00610 [Myxococcota bacterium]